MRAKQLISLPRSLVKPQNAGNTEGHRNSEPRLFSALRVLHNEGGILVDPTILSPDSPTHDFTNRTIYARVNSLSPFVIARIGYSICPLYDQGKSHRSGSTILINDATEAFRFKGRAQAESFIAEFRDTLLNPQVLDHP